MKTLYIFLERYFTYKKKLWVFREEMYAPVKYFAACIGWNVTAQQKQPSV